MKKEKFNLFLAISYILFVLVLLGITGVNLYLDKEVHKEDSSQLTRVSMKGDYSINDGEFQKYTGEDIPGEDVRKVVIRGHLDKQIKMGEKLQFYSSDLHITMEVNGKRVFEYGKKGTYPATSMTPGRGWVAYKLFEPIEPDDWVEITMECPLNVKVNSCYQELIEKLCVGDADGVLRMELKENGFEFYSGIFSSCLALILGMGLTILWLAQAPVHKSQFFLANFALISGVWITMRRGIFSLMIPYGVFRAMMYLVFMSLIGPSLVLYMRNFIEKKVRWMLDALLYAMIIIHGTGIVLVGIGKIEYYHTFFFIFIPESVAAVIATILIIRELQKKQNVLILVSIQCIIVVTAVDIISYMSGASQYMKGYVYGFLVFVVIQIGCIVAQLKREFEKSNQASRWEQEISDSKVSIMLSQIQPHFLYNVLGTIQCLCSENPKKAEEAIKEFAFFLRGNIDSLSSVNLISFTQELKHVNNYLSLEKIRFGDKLHIRYQVEEEDFLLPPLTIQPIVENAVRYGVTKKKGGGTVTISTKGIEEFIEITIKDDGVGFDPFGTQSDGRTHIGMSNVQNRIEMQCNGSMSIHSEKGKGTQVTIRIPKEEKHAGNSSR